MGGSIGLAARRRLGVEVVGYDPNTATVAEALSGMMFAREPACSRVRFTVSPSPDFGKTSSAFAPGPGATATRRQASSSAQKLWRFCRNKRVGFPALIEPLIQRVRDQSTKTGVLL